jgi:hypothetical protein
VDRKLLAIAEKGLLLQAVIRQINVLLLEVKTDGVPEGVPCGNERRSAPDERVEH